jgi:hypothetical protein
MKLRAFQRGIQLIEAATGTSFNWENEHLWMEEFLKNVDERTFVSACQRVAESWTLATRFPPVSGILREVCHIRSSPDHRNGNKGPSIPERHRNAAWFEQNRGYRLPKGYDIRLDATTEETQPCLP